MQVNKTLSDGSVVYAWSLAGVHDPDENVNNVIEGVSYPQLVWLGLGVTPDRPDLYFAYIIEESTRGTKGGITGSRWATCYVCQGDFPQNKMSFIKGHWYCREDSRDLS